MKKKRARKKHKKAKKQPKGIYISENGDWGDIDSLYFVEVECSEEDYIILSCLTQFMLLEYASEHDGKTPSEWYAEKYPDRA